MAVFIGYVIGPLHFIVTSVYTFHGDIQKTASSPFNSRQTIYSDHGTAERC